MGVCICEKHGRGGVVETCPHAAETIERGSYHHLHRIEIFGDLLVCEECLSKYELAEFERYPSEQDFITSLIENFIAASELNQAKVIFLEAEVWTPWSNPAIGASSYSRGKEILLRETLLNCP